MDFHAFLCLAEYKAICHIMQMEHRQLSLSLMNTSRRRQRCPQLLL